MFLKKRPSECLCEKIRHILRPFDVLKDDCPVLNFLANKVILDINVFGALVHFGVFGKLDCRDIVNIQWNRFDRL